MKVESVPDAWKNVRLPQYVRLHRGQMHAIEKQIKSVNNAEVSGETPGKRPFRVLTTPEKDSEKDEKQPKFFKKRLKKY